MEQGSFIGLLPGSLSNTLAASAALFIAYLLSIWTYRVLFHPLRKFPGPKTAAISSIPSAYHLICGTNIFWIISLHEKYDSEVVRISPNELSFSSANAYREIYGHRKTSLPLLKKDPVYYRSPIGEIEIVNATEPYDHVRMRKVFSHAFSDRALKLQEPLFNVHIDKLVRKIRNDVAKDPRKKFDIGELYNYTTLDVMADLCFGESLNLIDSSAYRPWVEAILAGFKYSNYLHGIRYFPWLEWCLVTVCLPRSMMEQVEKHRDFSRQRVDRRVEIKSDRPDIWGLALAKDNTESGLTRDEMYANSDVFMVAGTETTGTLVSGLTYYLLTNPARLSRFVSEIRDAVPSEDAITVQNLQNLTYMNACIEEGLRLYPPAVEGFPRLTPPGGITTIDGHEIPPGTKIFVASLAANMNPHNWYNPTSFLPERFLSDSEDSGLFANDKKHGHLPFSSGPRVCLGKSMAWQEIRLILAKVFYNFDVALSPDSELWTKDQKVYMTWDKPPLHCHFTPVGSAKHE